MLAIRGSEGCWSTHLDDVKGLVDRGLGVEGEAGVNLGGDLAGDDLEDLLAELDEETVEGALDLSVDVAALLLGVVDGHIHELGVLGLLGGGQDQGRVGGGILRLVLANGYGELLLALRSMWHPPNPIWRSRARFESSPRFVGGMELTGKVTCVHMLAAITCLPL